VLATGTDNKDIDTRAYVNLPATAGDDDEWSAKVETDGASNVVVQDVACAVVLLCFPGPRRVPAANSELRAPVAAAVS